MSHKARKRFGQDHCPERYICVIRELNDWINGVMPDLTTADRRRSSKRKDGDAH